MVDEVEGKGEENTSLNGNGIWALGAEKMC